MGSIALCHSWSLARRRNPLCLKSNCARWFLSMKKWKLTQTGFQVMALTLGQSRSAGRC